MEKGYAYDEAVYQLKEIEDYLEEYEPTENDLEDYVRRVLLAIHAKADYIIACL